MEIEVEDGALPVTVVGEGAVAVVIVPSIFGVHDDTRAQMAEMTGATAYAMDPFWRTHPGPVDYREPGPAFERMRAYQPSIGYGDVKALIAHARRRHDRVIGVGICFGGPFCFRAASEGRLDGVVTWHGSRLDAFTEGLAEQSTPLRLHFGGADTFVPPEMIERVREALAGHPDARLFVHPGAGHGFSHRDGPAFDAAAESAGLASVLELIGATDG